MADECISVSVSKQTVGTWCDRANGQTQTHTDTCKLIRELRERGGKKEG